MKENKIPSAKELAEILQSDADYNVLADPIKFASIVAIEFAEKEFSKMFPNGFESWYETFYEITHIIERHQDEGVKSLVWEVLGSQGRGGLYELAKKLTDKFELLHKDKEWEGEYFDEIERFLETELKI